MEVEGGSSSIFLWGRALVVTWHTVDKQRGSMPLLFLFYSFMSDIS